MDYELLKSPKFCTLDQTGKKIIQFEPHHEKTCPDIPTRSETHRAVQPEGGQWLTRRALGSGGRSWVFETYLRRVVSFSKTLYSPKVLVRPRKRWLRPHMTGKLLNGTLSLTTNKQTEDSLRVLTHQKPPRRFCMIFFEVLPLTTLASSVNGKTSKKSVQKRRGGVWCV